MSATSAEANDGAGVWTWATEHGEPESSSTDLLLSQLASGQLPPYTLVWREGWGEWLPAMQVAELADAFPEVPSEVFRSARPADAPSGRPPVPISEYPRLRLMVKDVQRKVSPEPPAAAEARPSGDESGVAVAFDAPDHEVITSEVPAAALVEAARAMTHPSPPADLGLAEAVRLSSMPPPPAEPELIEPELIEPEPLEPSDLEAPARVLAEAITPLRSAAPLAEELGLGRLLESPAEANGPPRLVRAHGLWVALGAVALAGLVVFLARRWLSVGPATPPSEPRASSSSGPAPAPTESGRQPAAVTAVGACRLSRDPVRLDDWAISEVPPQVMALPGAVSVRDPVEEVILSVHAGQVAVGYAQSHKRAVGLTLDPDTLSVERRVMRRRERQIFSVTPLVADGVLRFHAERMGSSVACSRALPTDPPLRIGMNEDGLVIGGLDQRAEKVWGLPPRTLISVPAMARHEKGYTVATLAGHKLGPVRVGVMSHAGEPLSALAQIGDDDARFGKPDLASGPRQTALVVAAQSSSGPAQSIWLSRADNGRVPTVLEPFDPGSPEPVGGGAGDLDAPAIAALPDGSFALLFSQGRGAKRRVRLQRLSKSLAPVGSPIDVSAPDPRYRGASVGSLHWVAGRLLGFYFMSRDEGYALWAASLECES